MKLIVFQTHNFPQHLSLRSPTVCKASCGLRALPFVLTSATLREFNGPTSKRPVLSKAFQGLSSAHCPAYGICRTRSGLLRWLLQSPARLRRLRLLHQETQTSIAQHRGILYRHGLEREGLVVQTALRCTHKTPQTLVQIRLYESYKVLIQNVLMQTVIPRLLRQELNLNSLARQGKDGNCRKSF